MFPLLMVACGTSKAERLGVLHEDVVYDHDGVERTYHFYESTTEDAAPLVVLLHGGGGVIDNHIGVKSVDWPHQVWLDIADEESLHVVAPQGLNKHWNDCRAECERCGEQDDLGFLVALVDHLASENTVDLSRVYVVGESNGGFMTQRLAQEAPSRFAAMGVVIALQPAESTCTAQDVPMPMMFQVGTADAGIPYEGGQVDAQVNVLSAEATAALWRDLNGCETESASTSFPDLDPDDQSTARRDDYTCSRAALSVVTLDGAGHVPPSIEVHVSSFWEGVAGIQNHDVEGAREFWGFFKDATRPQ